MAKMNATLDRIFIENEVVTTLKSISVLKATSEDGFGAVFFQRF